MKVRQREQQSRAFNHLLRAVELPEALVQE